MSSRPPVPTVVLRSARVSLVIAIALVPTIIATATTADSVFSWIALALFGLALVGSVAIHFFTSIVVTPDLIIVNRLHTVDLLRTDDIRAAELERYGTGIKVDGERVRLPFPIRGGLLHDAIHKLQGDSVPARREPFAFGPRTQPDLIRSDQVPHAARTGPKGFV